MERDDSLTLEKVSMSDTARYGELQRARTPLLDGITDEQKAMVHDNDEHCDLYLLRHGNIPISTARIHHKDGLLKLERVAVCKSWQKKGIGKKLLQLVLSHYEGSEIIVYAFKHVEGFYYKCSFKAVEVVQEDGFELVKMIYSS